MSQWEDSAPQYEPASTGSDSCGCQASTSQKERAETPAPFYQPSIPTDQPTGVPEKPVPTTGIPSQDIAPPQEEGTGAEGPVSKCGPRIGYVALAGEDFLKVQSAVDKGVNPWRLDPVQTAREVGAAKLGFSRNDRFWFKGSYVDAGSGLHHALVWATHKTCVYQMELYQPVKQGSSGIWAVERVNEMETRSIRL